MIKKKIFIIVILLCFSLTLTGCHKKTNLDLEDDSISSDTNDDLKNIIKDDLTNKLGDNYQVDYVDSVYMSKEYIEEVTYNGKDNIYFGYNYDQIARSMGNKNWTFTVSDDGKTVVSVVEEANSALFNLVKNLAIVRGIIMVGTIISIISENNIRHSIACFVVGAANLTLVAATTGALISGITAGIVEGIKTGDFAGSIECGVNALEKGFKYGALAGSLMASTIVFPWLI